MSQSWLLAHHAFNGLLFDHNWKRKPMTRRLCAKFLHHPQFAISQRRSTSLFSARRDSHRNYSCRRVRHETYCESIRTITLLCPVTHGHFAQTPAGVHQVAATDPGSRHEPAGPGPSKTTAVIAREESRRDRQTARTLLSVRPLSFSAKPYRLTQLLGDY